MGCFGRETEISDYGKAPITVFLFNLFTGCPAFSMQPTSTRGLSGMFLWILGTIFLQVPAAPTGFIVPPTVVQASLGF